MSEIQKNNYVDLTEDDYEAVRAALDAANGFPCEHNGVVTTTTLPPADEVPKTEDGRIPFCFDRTTMRQIHETQALNAVLTRTPVLEKEAFQSKSEEAMSRKAAEIETKQTVKQP